MSVHAPDPGSEPTLRLDGAADALCALERIVSAAEPIEPRLSELFGPLTDDDRLQMLAARVTGAVASVLDLDEPRQSLVRGAVAEAIRRALGGDRT